MSSASISAGLRRMEKKRGSSVAAATAISCTVW